MSKKILIILFLLALTALTFYLVKNNQASQITNQTSDGQKKYYFPISRYKDRLTFRKYGQRVTSVDKPTCGFPFEGIHNADDLEAFDYEQATIVPIYAVTNGEVVFKNYVDGYGGLIVIKSRIDNQDVLLNYGHINVSTAKVTVNDIVEPGQEIAFLGEGCSSETDGERKHLHFAIHKGTTLDVKGYLQKEQELENWLNPLETLERLRASNK